MDCRAPPCGERVREQSPLRHSQGRLSCRELWAHTLPTSRGAAHVCRRYVHVRIYVSGGCGLQIWKYLPHNRGGWICTEHCGKDPNGPSKGHLGYYKIQRTIAKIERDTHLVVGKMWKKLFRGSKPYGVFVAKIDISDVSMEELQQAWPQIEQSLLTFGYDLYSIDYTQDFSGVARPTSSATRSIRTTCWRKTPHHPGKIPPV